VEALCGVSFAVQAGQTVGIMGANGAGKTTLFALIAGNEALSAGDIRLRGASIAGLRPDQICRRGIGRTFQIVRPFGGLSVLENVTVAALFGAGRQLEASAAEHRARELIHRVGLDGRAASPAGALTLSGQKRLEVARAMATGAQIVLLDEVMAGLTPAEVDEMVRLLSALRTEYRLTLLVIEHVMQGLMRLADRMIALHLGRLIADGTPAEVARHPDVLRSYLGEDAA
jgi:branched-chain amino acid transport system ATP-binding protein